MAPLGRNPWILKSPTARSAVQTQGREQQVLRAAQRQQQDAVAAAPRMSLFCFPPAGSGAYVFHGWERQLPPDVEVSHRQGKGKDDWHAGNTPVVKCLPAASSPTRVPARPRRPSQVLPVELPGRNSRIKEAPLSSMDELVE
jgi:surfactin synthase thioesterase subunit